MPASGNCRRWTAPFDLVLPALLCVLSCARVGAWEVRYAHLRNQKPEWTAAGYVPRWEIREEGDAVVWEDDIEGDCRGTMLFGRPLPIPGNGTSPAAVVVSLEFRTQCALSRPDMQRSGVLSVCVMPEATWSGFAAAQREARIQSATGADGTVVSCQIKGQGRDVTDWEPAGPLRLALPPGLRESNDLMLVLVWSGYHMGTDEHGGFRKVSVETVSEAQERWRFWGELDLTRDELGAVRAAVEARNETAATAALAAHLRTRTTPVVANPVGTSAAHVRRADAALAHTYRLAGCPPYTFEGEMVWNADPFDYNQWPVALNRHTEWLSLASAHLTTGEAKYAHEWDAQLLHWTASMPTMIAPRWIQGPYNAPGRIPLSLDAGIRMGQSWFPTFEQFRRCAEVSDEALVTFARSCLRHADYLVKPENFREGSNWGAMESNGLYHIGVMMPEFRRAAEWRELAAQRQFAELDNQVYPDGAQVELAPGYHGVSLRNFLGITRLAAANNLSLPEGYTGRLERMYDYYLRIMTPSGRVPDLNDSGSGSVAGALRQAAALFPERQDFLWGGTRGQQGVAPSYDCTVMPYAGWVAMRSDWTPEASYLVFDAGPYGTGHQHEDKLGILLYAYGRPLLTECGKYAYDTSQWRRYCLSTRGHNTVRVDGEDQNCRGARAEFRADAPRTYGFFNSPDYCYARDTYSVGYGARLDRTVTHRRRVLFVKPDMWIVVDDLASTDEAEHMAEVQFLLDAESVDIDRGTLAACGVGGGRGRLAIVPLSTEGLTVRVAMGETEPEVRGFVPEGFEKLRPVPAVLYTRRFSGQASVAYALVPFEGDVPPVAMVDGVLRLRGRPCPIVVSPTALSIADADRPFVAEEPALAGGML